MSENLTPMERKVLDKLVDAWNIFVFLPTEHLDDMNEFRQGIHRLQDKILARPTRRIINMDREIKHDNNKG